MKIYGIEQNIGGLLKRGGCECGCTDLVTDTFQKYDRETGNLSCCMIVFRCTSCGNYYNGTGGNTEEYHSHKREDYTINISQKGLEKSLNESGASEEIIKAMTKNINKYIHDII